MLARSPLSSVSFGPRGRRRSRAVVVVNVAVPGPARQGGDHREHITANGGKVASPRMPCTAAAERAATKLQAQMQPAGVPLAGPDLIESIRRKIQEGVGAESVTVTDLRGDGRHLDIAVVASSFEGKSAVTRQRDVYKTIWAEINGGPVHAVDAMTARTPAEARAKAAPAS